jgi:dipeptidase E
MRLLLTSAGITNTSIRNALVDLLGKPIAESSALCIPNGIQPFRGGPSHVYRFITGSAPGPMCELGWKSLGVLELTALPSIKEEHWIPEVQETDALLVWGGSPLYLCYWMRQSGLADLLPSLRREMVYVGTSGGAMVATPDFGGETYDDSAPLTSSDSALDWLISRCFRTSSARTCRTLPWPTSKDGPQGYQYRRTRLTIRPR